MPSPHFKGCSQGGRALPAYRFGSGPVRISLIAGCHADEPTGPRLLRKLVTFLDYLEKNHPMLQAYSWCIVPHANPDGEAVNRKWYREEDTHYNLARYLRHVLRALPGEDIEFGFPIENVKVPLGPENQFIYDLWRRAGAPFHLHASLHSIAIAFGAWFLIDPDWAGRSQRIREKCRRETEALGYPFHDVDRRGEKGFHRIAEGFCTRPDWKSMQAFFLRKGDPQMAARFHPSSMESIRSLGGDCLTLVSELPLFIIPRKNPDLSWPNPEYDRWKNLLDQWKMQLLTGKKTEQEVNEEARQTGLRPMPVEDQMRLQWSLVSAGLTSL